MGFSASNSQAGGDAPRPARNHDPRGHGTGPSEGTAPANIHQPAQSKEESYRALLDVVLKQTLLAEDAQAQDRLESLDDLIAVADRRQGEPFSVDPIGIELVQTVLRTPFRALVASDAQWQAMTEQIARTLFDDAASYDRLSNLWRRLGERCRHGN